MRKITLPLALLGAALGVCLQAAPAEAQATRTWVSGVGDDVNPCSRTAPCKTFAGAISKTAAGGEINCIDPGGFGAVTITKSITIDCLGTLGSILAAGTNGVNVNAAGINVVLRNLLIQGAITGLIGVNFINGASLRVENVLIHNFNSGTAVGIKFSPSSANAVLVVTDSTIASNGIAPSTGAGILVQPAVGGTNALVTLANTKVVRNGGAGVAAISNSASIAMTISNSLVSHNTNGGINSTATSSIATMIDHTTISSNSQNGVLASGANALVRIGNSVINANAVGVASAASGVLRSYKNNAINGNGTEGTPITQEALN
jgi:hypothetical protein